MDSPRIQEALQKIEDIRKQLRHNFSKEIFEEVKAELRQRDPLDGTLILVLHLLDYFDVYLRLCDATVEAIRIVDEEWDTDDDNDADSSSDSDGDSDGDRSSDGKLWRTTSNGVTVSWLSCGYNGCQDNQRLGSIPP